MSEWNKEKLVELLNTNDRAIERAMVVLYNRQTLGEQATGDTHILNGIGFSGAHSKLGTYYAKWVLNGNKLSGSHLAKARKIALRYTSQLLDEIKNKQKCV